ncbi:MAG: ABC transporter ATP-binding protein [bacterium]
MTASVSAALHAVLAGLLVWMAGPLMMTLFQIDNIAGVDPTAVAAPALSPGGSGSEFVEEVAGSIDRLRDRMKGAVNDLVTTDSRKGTLIRFCWLIMLVVISKNLFYYLQGFFMAFVQQSVVRDLRDRLFKKYQSLSLAYFHRRRTGQVMSRVTNDVLVLNESIDLSFNYFVSDSIQALMFLAFLIILSWKLTLLAMVIMPVVFAFIWFIGKKMRKYSERTQERMADVNSVLEENVSNIRIVKAFATEDYEIGKFLTSTGEFFRSLVRMTRIRHLSSPINDTLISFAGVVILLYAGSKIVAGSGELDAGDFMTFVIAMFSMIKPVKSLSQIHVRVQEGMAAAKRIFQVLDTSDDIVTTPGAVKLSGFKRDIEFKEVSFQYDADDEKVLDKVSFRVEVGQIVAVVGPSGAGKSTLLDLLVRFYDPQAGVISIDGHDIRDIALPSLRGMMGIVTQETLLFNDSVAINIAYGLPDTPHDKIVQAARMANAHDFIREFDRGYETLVGNRGVRLSGGQRQRLAIARALLRDPQILIFDEATSALDTESEQLVQEAIGRLMHDRTTLVVAHRLSTIINADHIIVLERGRIVQQGRHDELLGQPGVYQKLYNLQFQNGAASPDESARRHRADKTEHRSH